jgi:probable rRNA maturation factor
MSSPRVEATWQGRKISKDIKVAVIALFDRALVVQKRQGDFKVEIDFVTDEVSRDLNKTHRGKDYPTDVLSFGTDVSDSISAEQSLLGSIVIANDILERQAVEYATTADQELVRLTVHGFMHLLGLDHEQDQVEWDQVENQTYEQKQKTITQL